MEKALKFGRLLSQWRPELPRRAAAVVLLATAGLLLACGGESQPADSTSPSAGQPAAATEAPAATPQPARRGHRGAGCDAPNSARRGHRRPRLSPAFRLKRGRFSPTAFRCRPPAWNWSVTNPSSGETLPWAAPRPACSTPRSSPPGIASPSGRETTPTKCIPPAGKTADPNWSRSPASSPAFFHFPHPGAVIRLPPRP